MTFPTRGFYSFCYLLYVRWLVSWRWYGHGMGMCAPVGQSTTPAVARVCAAGRCRAHTRARALVGPGVEGVNVSGWL
jgi:hypothetical protein